MADSKGSLASLSQNIADDLDDEDEDSDDEHSPKSGSGGGQTDAEDEGDPDEDDQDEKDEKDEGKEKAKSNVIQLTPEELDAKIKEAATQAANEAAAGVKSAKDKEIAQLRRSQRDAEDAAIKREREAAARGLSAEDRAKLQADWNLDDREREIKRKEEASEQEAKELQAARLAHQYRDSGVTEDELLDCDTPAQMEILCLKKDRERLAKGESAQGNDGTSTKGKEKPAGARQKTDIGGGGGAATASNRKKGSATTLEDFGKSLFN